MILSNVFERYVKMAPISVMARTDLSSHQVKGIFVNIFGGIMRCDVIAEGIIQATRQLSLTVPLVVRLAGTNVEQGKDLLRKSGLQIEPADTMGSARGRGRGVFVRARPDLWLGVARQVFSRGFDIFCCSSGDGVTAFVRERDHVAVKCRIDCDLQVGSGIYIAEFGCFKNCVKLCRNFGAAL